MLLLLLDQRPHFENHCSRQTLKVKATVNNNNYYHLLSIYYMSLNTLVLSILHIIASFIPIVVILYIIFF